MARPNLYEACSEALVAIVSHVSDNPRQLKPGQLCRLLNSTPLGTVLGDRKLRAHRERAGHRIGDGKTVDLLRYAAWLATINPRETLDLPKVSRETIIPIGDSYERKKVAERDRQAAKSRKGRDIGACPEVENPKRRRRAEKSLRFFCETYFPELFKLAWSDDQLKVIARIEKAVLVGGQFAMAMPRGSGKTTLCEIACLWALSIAARKFVLFIGSSVDAAEELLASVKVHIESNDIYAADFPAICYPLREIEGRANLCAGQLSEGERTHITYGKKVLVLPTIAGSEASGGILRVAGITGRLRGMSHTRSDGERVRPDLVIVDDPQTDASAKSEPMCAQRERLLAGAILGLAGPGQKIAAIMPCTVIRRGDVADNILDRSKHPDWQGERMRMVRKFPKNEKLWDEYGEIRSAELAAGGDGSQATAFYRKNRKAMDEGAEVSWPARFNDDELSALQNAMNLRLKDEAAFWAEYQNDPDGAKPPDELQLTIAIIITRKNGVARGIVPLWASRLTLAIDVQHHLLYWMCCGWSDAGRGAVVDYNVWPEQSRSYFTYRTVKRTLKLVHKASTVESAVSTGLSALTLLLLSKNWKTESGAELRIERCLVDAADGTLTDTIFEFVRASPMLAMIYPAIGRGIGPDQTQMHQYKAKPGEFIGDHWMSQPAPRRAARQIVIDANYWKAYALDRLAMLPTDPHSISLFGGRGADHRMLADHLVSEDRSRLKSEKTGITRDMFKHKPNKPDNHLLDVFANNCVAASHLGVGKSKPAAKAASESRSSIDVSF